MRLFRHIVASVFTREQTIPVFFHPRTERCPCPIASLSINKNKAITSNLRNQKMSLFFNNMRRPMRQFVPTKSPFLAQSKALIFDVIFRFCKRRKSPCKSPVSRLSHCSRSRARRTSPHFLCLSMRNNNALPQRLKDCWCWCTSQPIAVLPVIVRLQLRCLWCCLCCCFFCVCHHASRQLWLHKSI